MDFVEISKEADIERKRDLDLCKDLWKPFKYFIFDCSISFNFEF